MNNFLTKTLKFKAQLQRIYPNLRIMEWKQNSFIRKNKEENMSVKVQCI